MKWACDPLPLCKQFLFASHMQLFGRSLSHPGCVPVKLIIPDNLFDSWAIINNEKWEVEMLQ